MGAQPGEVLDGKYRVERVIGIGGMGTVVAAHHLALETRVAIKILRPSLLTTDDAVASFMREARAAIRMGNEHVTRVFDVGRLPTGTPFIVMEFLEGFDLGTLLLKHGPFAVDTAVDFVLQATEAVAEAHAYGIVHRDIKPSNLFCIRRPDGRPLVKVLDFGISKVIGTSGAAAASSRAPATKRTTPGAATPPPLVAVPANAAFAPVTGAAAETRVTGTPFYMSPEQIQAPQTVDARTDIWALGVVLYELLSGRPPFRGQTLPEVAVEIAASRPRPLSALAPAVPEKLAAVIDTCLAKDRNNRYPNVVQLAWALLPFGPPRARSSAERIADILQAPGSPVVELSLSTSLSSSTPWLAARAGQTAATRATAVAARPLTPRPRGDDRADKLVGKWAGNRVGKRAGKRAGVTAAIAMAAVGILAVAYTAAGRRASPPWSPLALPARVLAPSLKRLPASVPAPLPAAVSVDRGKPAVLVVPSSARRMATGAPLDVTDVPDALTEATRRGRPSAPGDRDPRGARLGRTLPAPRRAAPSPLPVAAPVKPVAKPDCNPNYDLDEQGRKHFKPACFLNQGR